MHSPKPMLGSKYLLGIRQSPDSHLLLYLCLPQIRQLDSIFPASQSRGAAVPSGRNPISGSTSAASNQQPQQAQQHDITGSLNPVWDWSLKTRIKVSSPQPFACLEEATEVGLEPGTWLCCASI
eukprot:jgi/Chrzof1/155/Cz01g05120.t1